MALLRLLTACFSVAVALQIGQDRKNQKSLPEVSEVLSKPKDVFEALTSKISSLNARLMEAQQEGKAAMETQKNKYESALAAQRQNNTALARKNNDTTARIYALKASNEELRLKTRALMEESASLTADLKAMQANISTADEFVASALNASTEMLQSAPQLQVLKELAQRDDDVRENRYRESRLNEIRVSFLQTEAITSGIEAKDLLDSLNSALDDLANEQNASALSFKNAFEKEYQVGEDKHNALLEKQAELNATETSALRLNERLMAAVKHLEQTRDALFEKRKSLKLYMQHVGALALPEQKQGTMLLQVGKGLINKQALPDVSAVLSTQTKAFEAFSSKLNSLEARLTESQKENSSAMKAQRTQYDATLESQRQNNTALARKNNDTIARINVLKASNEELRSKARAITEQSASLTADLKIMKANISTADEFVANALDASTEMLQSAPQLQVLKELAQKDAALDDNRDHENRLRQIRASMLQTSTSGSTSGIDAQNILDSLNSALDDLSKEQDESVLSLKNAFEKEYKAGEEQHQELLINEAELNATETAALKLKERLTAAVEHLEHTRDTLLEKRQGLGLYMQRVGGLIPPEQGPPEKQNEMQKQTQDQKQMQNQNQTQLAVALKEHKQTQTQKQNQHQKQNQKQHHRVRSGPVG